MFKIPRWRGELKSMLVSVLIWSLVLSTVRMSPSAAAAPSEAPLPSAFARAGAATASSAFAQYLESKYVDPDRVYGADTRWWLGQASHTDQTLLEQIQTLYNSGFRGVELCMQNDNGAPTATYAYGSDMWAHKWKLMMNKLLDMGMGVYLTSGTNWATSNVPGLDPASQSAMQNLTLGTGTVDAGANLTVLPAPQASARKAGATFFTAYAYKVVTGNTVDPTSFVNLKPLLTQGADVWTQNLTWTSPATGQYRVFALWNQGTYQAASPAAQTSYATNYFDVRGVAALKAFWEQHYLSDPVLNEKIKHGDVQLFMDSLEINTGNGFTWWAEDLAQQFQARKGYDITPYLFLISGVSAPTTTGAYWRVNDTGTYRLDGAESLRQRIVNDWQDVLTQVYEERMLTPLKTWLNSIGIKTRAQISYGQPLEISEPAMYVDYPETESLNTYDQVDILRLWSGGAKLENKVLSTEAGAQLTPFASHQTSLRDVYSMFDGGIQRIIFHVYAADYGYGNYAWPGYAPGFGLTSFRYPGTRNPNSADYDEMNAHIGRVQELLQTGKSRTDVGFIHQDWIQGVRFGGGVASDNTGMNWEFAHQGVYYRSTELQNNGYTYGYFSPRFLFDNDVSFNTTTKTIEAAGYKAIVIYEKWLDLAAAQRILDWAQQGLKVVVIGNIGAATQTPFNDGKDAQLAAVIAQLEALPTVRVATVFDAPADYFSSAAGGYRDDAMAKLQELGVYPYAAYPQPNHQLLTQTRVDANGNEYLYVHNYCPNDYHGYSLDPRIVNEDHGTNIKTTIGMAGQFVPYQIDAWTGNITELANYTWQNGRTIIPIDLDFDNIALYAFQKVSSDQLHVVSTNAASAHAIAGGAAVRATSSGTVTTQLSNGIAFQQAISVPAPYDITNWDLTVQSWNANPTAGDLVRTETIDGVTTVNKKTSTVLTPISVKLDKLTTWDNIPAVGKTVSGNGHYAATFNWDASKASGAYLDFGSTLNDSMKVWINGKQVGGDVSTNPTKVKKDVGGVGKPTIDDGTGKQVPLVGHDEYTGGVNWMKPVVDVSAYLVNGSNTITIDYNSSLENVLLSRGLIKEMKPYVSAYRSVRWWDMNQVYNSYGPMQAKIVPFVDVAYTMDTATTIGATYNPIQ